MLRDFGNALNSLPVEAPDRPGVEVLYRVLDQLVEHGHEVVITDLNSFSVPMIRYQTGDRAAAMDETTCGCGRGLTQDHKHRLHPDGTISDVRRGQADRHLDTTHAEYGRLVWIWRNQSSVAARASRRTVCGLRSSQ